MGKDDTKSVVAANIAELMRWAGEHGRPYSSPKTLAKRIGISHMTIYRILDKGGAQIDTLDSIAGVFRLRAWQLMIPNLDPSNPPTIPYTPEEKRLYERIGKVLQAVESHEPEPESDNHGMGSDPKSTSKGKSGAKTQSKSRKARTSP